MNIFSTKYHIVRFLVNSVLIIILTFAVSCKKFVTIPPTSTKIDQTAVFQTDAAAIALMTGVYSNATNVIEGHFPYLSIATAEYADELTDYGVGDANFAALYANNLTNRYTYFWSEFYNFIYITNEVIEGVHGPNGLTPSTQTRLEGEAKFTRAMFYYYLVQLYGDVPLVTATDYTQNYQMARTPQAQVYQQMVSDLKDAENLLGTDYTNADLKTVSTTGRYRPNKWAAAALLARVDLTIGNYADAITESSNVINQTGTYTLDAFSNVFLTTSKEAILQFQPSTNASVNTYDGNTFILVAVPDYTHPVSMSNTLYNAFEAGDNRKTNWVGSFTSGATTYYFPYKYKVRQVSTAPVNNITEADMILRLGEQYLIRAEAYIQSNQIAQGIADINTIRARARAAATVAVPNPLPALSTSLTQQAALMALEHERQVELFTELGDRWFTLKRLKGYANNNISRADEYMPAVTADKGGTWNTNKQLFPIPLSDLTTDVFLKQNPGY